MQQHLCSVIFEKLKEFVDSDEPNIEEIKNNIVNFSKNMHIIKTILENQIDIFDVSSKEMKKIILEDADSLFEKSALLKKFNTNDLLMKMLIGGEINNINQGMKYIIPEIDITNNSLTDSYGTISLLPISVCILFLEKKLNDIINILNIFRVEINNFYSSTKLDPNFNIEEFYNNRIYNILNFHCSEDTSKYFSTYDEVEKIKIINSFKHCIVENFLLHMFNPIILEFLLQFNKYVNAVSDCQIIDFDTFMECECNNEKFNYFKIIIMDSYNKILNFLLGDDMELFDKIENDLHNRFKNSIHVSIF